MLFMDAGVILLFVCSVALAGFLVLYLFRQMQGMKEDFHQQVTQLQQTVSQRFDSNVQTVTSHLGIITGQITNTTNVVAQVEGKLGQMQQASQQIFDLAKQMSSLQEILQSPKMRGGFGEFLLNDLLAQCLRPDAYKVQSPFKNGTIVDAALFIGKSTLCIDSKFPLENFRRMYQTEGEPERRNLRKQFLNDVKKHINDISTKYILPEENTLDFALMFIPAENVYYELIVRDENDLYEHCLLKKVIPVSPNTFYAYLQVILQGLRGFQISEQAKRILAQLQQVGNDLDRLDVDFTKIGSHLRDAQSSFEKSDFATAKIEEKSCLDGHGRAGRATGSADQRGTKLARPAPLRACVRKSALCLSASVFKS
jgi:DNA recombination protein RmuC